MASRRLWALTGWSIAEDTASSEASGGLEPNQAGKEGFSKPAEGKSKPEGRKTKEGGKENPNSFLLRTVPFQRVTPTPRSFFFLGLSRRVEIKTVIDKGRGRPPGGVRRPRCPRTVDRSGHGKMNPDYAATSASFSRR